MRTRFVLAMALVLGSTAALAVDSTQWPPPPEVLEHMKVLQARIADPGASKEERAAARAELERLMKSPAGADKKTADQARKPARAAIEPFPSVMGPSTGSGRTAGRTAQPEKFGPPPPTAHVEVIDPPRKPVVDPQTGSLIQPTAPGVAVDPRTGHMLQETPGAYIDPRTGRIIPK